MELRPVGSGGGVAKNETKGEESSTHVESLNDRDSNDKEFAGFSSGFSGTR
jgi:hypothetical protein